MKAAKRGYHGHFVLQFQTPIGHALSFDLESGKEIKFPPTGTATETMIVNPNPNSQLFVISVNAENTPSNKKIRFLSRSLYPMDHQGYGAFTSSESKTGIPQKSPSGISPADWLQEGIRGEKFHCRRPEITKSQMLDIADIRSTDPKGREMDLVRLRESNLLTGDAQTDDLIIEVIRRALTEPLSQAQQQEDDQKMDALDKALCARANFFPPPRGAQRKGPRRL